MSTYIDTMLQGITHPKAKEIIEKMVKEADASVIDKDGKVNPYYVAGYLSAELNVMCHKLYGVNQ